MLILRICTSVALTLSLCWSATAQKNIEADICVYGATSAGVIAAYTATMMGKKVVLVEPGGHVGGLSSGGLGYTDIGNKYAITGLALDFYRRIGAHYGKFEQWIFEPHVAEDLFKSYITKAGFPVMYHHRLLKTEKQAGSIVKITVEDGQKPGIANATNIRAKVFIDCSYEGDLMQQAGVSYTVGREDNSQYAETYNGVQLLGKHQFPDGIDPYTTPGKPESGLIWGVTANELLANGTGDKKVQAYNFRICLTNQPQNRVDITKPNDYTPARYELLVRYLEKKPAGDLWGFLKFDLMPNNKTDINNNGPFSTDMIGENYSYAEADYATRQQIVKQHEDYAKGLLYFIGHDERMPAHLRKEMLQWGYPKDEYQDNNHWSPQLYVREARRMVGAYVMTQANCEGREVVPDGIGLAAYTMDSHNCQRLVVNGMVKNEGDVQIGGFGPYPISYRALIPKENECKNLLVPVCLSASHIAYGSIRMEPVFMALGQAAAVAAILSIDDKKTVQAADVAKLQNLLKVNPLADGTTPEIITDNDDEKVVTIKGKWGNIKHAGFGPSLLESSADDTTATIRFSPSITKNGFYKLYAYLIPKYKNLAASIPVAVYDGNQLSTATIKPADVQVKGQTSGEWVLIGRYQLSANQQPYAELKAQGGNGIVTADALLWKPDF